MADFHFVRVICCEMLRKTKCTQLQHPGNRGSAEAYFCKGFFLAMVMCLYTCNKIPADRFRLKFVHNKNTK